MNTKNKLGIWLDHSKAYLIELTATEPMETKTIASTFTHEEKEFTKDKNENLMHNKEQHQQSSYFKQLEEVIKNYDEVLLFGPTTAKNELANLMKANHQFEKVKVTVKDADKMTDNQQHAFVREHFFKAIN